MPQEFFNNRGADFPVKYWNRYLLLGSPESDKLIHIRLLDLRDALARVGVADTVLQTFDALQWKLVQLRDKTEPKFEDALVKEEILRRERKRGTDEILGKIHDLLPEELRIRKERQLSLSFS